MYLRLRKSKKTWRPKFWQRSFQTTPLSVRLKICLTFGAVTLPWRSSLGVEKLSKLKLGCFRQQNSDEVKVQTQVFQDDFELKYHNI